MQSGSLYLATMDPKNPQHESLVFPDEIMVSRQGRDYLKKYKIPEENFEFVDQFKDLKTLMEEQEKTEYSYKNYGTRLPMYAFCNLLQFRTPLHRETAYELLPEDQKKDLHGRAVSFLENEAHRCKACGNLPFFKVPAFNAPMDKSDSRVMASIVDHPICLLVPDFNVDVADVPNSMAGVIMTAFDSLDPFTHFLVKAASVLGTKFMRSMLIHVMEFPSP
ncbi:hypothetical protein J437_LFUL014951, partial [Ladona fulva]